MRGGISSSSWATYEGDGRGALVEAKVDAGFLLLRTLALALEGACGDASLAALLQRWINHDCICRVRCRIILAAIGRLIRTR